MMIKLLVLSIICLYCLQNLVRVLPTRDEPLAILGDYEHKIGCRKSTAILPRLLIIGNLNHYIICFLSVVVFSC